MKCLSREEIQEYVDNEAAIDAQNEIVKHLATCELCLSLYNEAIEDKSIVKRYLDAALWEDESGFIPAFKFPIRKNLYIKKYRLIAVLAAATLIGFVFLFRFDGNQVIGRIPEAEILINEFYEGKDLNRLWHDKSQILIIQDENGNVIQSIITY